MTGEQIDEVDEEKERVELNTDGDASSLSDGLNWRVVALTGFAVVIIISLIITGTNPLDWITQEVVILVGFFILGLVFLTPVTIAGIKLFWSPPMVFVADIDAADAEGFELYAGHPDLARQLHTREGKLNKIDVHGRRVWIGRDLDVDEGAITGTWRGLATDLEILNSEQSIKTNRGRLKYYARIGREIDAKLPGVVEAMEGAVWRSITSNVMESTAYDADTVRREIYEEVNALDDAEQPDSAEAAAQAELNQEMKNKLDTGGDEL